MSACEEKKRLSLCPRDNINFEILLLSVFEMECPYVVQGSIEILILLLWPQKF